MRYDLDCLGWSDFEALVQALLKERISLGVEAWGGAGDWGRDAFFSGSLPYPTPVAHEGPFVFQCKFVGAANAAGAKAEPALLAAVKKESARIADRATRPGLSASGPATRHYVLLTNVVLGGGWRVKLSELIRSVLPRCEVHIHDGADVCVWVDVTPEIVRSFPQILATQKLRVLLERWTSRAVVTRSAAAIKEGERVAHVFVPTAAYRRAVEKVERHNFVVLEGPPEMGKTSIGRIIALSALSRGWEAFEVRRPADFFAAHSPDQRQIFVADDFFGRTEYDPRLTSEWQAELPHILGLLGPQHWLVLTSRAHLLNLAKADLDIGPAGAKFPKKGEVVVDAKSLSRVEKAHLLYRQAKAAGLSEQVKALLRAHAASITDDANFTPERIRILVQDRLQCSEADPPLSSADIGRIILETLRDPTRGMSISYGRLSSAHKWLMFAIIDREGYPPPMDRPAPTLQDAYERLCPLTERQPFENAVAAMRNAFVTDDEANEARLTWVHPSCRDLAIAELGKDVRLRSRFLKTCSWGGLHVSTSVGGGAQGKIAFPLLRTEFDWIDFEARALALLDSAAACDALFNILHGNIRAHGAVGRTENVDRLASIVSEVLWPRAVEVLNESGCWTLELLRKFSARPNVGRTSSAAPTPSFPWKDIVEAALSAIRNDRYVLWDENRTRACSHFSDAVEVFSQLSLSMPESEVRAVTKRVCDCALEEGDAEYDTSDWTSGDFDLAYRGFDTWANLCMRLAQCDVLAPLEADLLAAQDQFSRLSERFLHEEAPYSDREPSVDARDVDFDALFSDL